MIDKWKIHEILQSQYPKKRAERIERSFINNNKRVSRMLFKERRYSRYLKKRNEISKKFQLLRNLLVCIIHELY